MAQRWQYVTQTFYKRLYHINNGTQSAIHFSGVSDDEESTWNAEDLDSIPGWEDPLKEDMATRSSILAARIPMVEKPGRLQSMGL